MSKSQDQRVKDAARILAAYDKSGVGQSYEQWAAKILAAADREPTWPTDESMLLIWGPDADLDDEWRSDIRSAFLADPIIKAARALAESASGTSHSFSCCKAVIDAVNEAGL